MLFKNKEILVTGGAGFLGSHLCRRLVGLGARVFCLDNLSTGFRSNIVDIETHKNFTFVEHDIRRPLKKLTVDMIYHFACPASPPKYQADPVGTLITNFQGTLNILELAKQIGAIFFLASTSEVYGDPTESPQAESYKGNVNTFGPRACYDEGKRCAESLSYEYNHTYKVPIRIARFFNTYGPNMDQNDGRVISNFICQALKGDDITIYGNGQQTRSFCFVDDLIDGMLKLMQSECMTPMNLGNPNELSINEIADLIIKLTESRSKKVFLSLPLDDPVRRCPNINKAQDLLNWSPSVPLERGLLSTINYFEKKLSKELVPTISDNFKL